MNHTDGFGKKTCSCKGKCNCPREYSDHDASWGHETEECVFFGYKIHLTVDAKSQLPLDVKVTPANETDCPRAKPLMKGAKGKHPELKLV
jgi:hypothetical protein